MGQTGVICFSLILTALLVVVVSRRRLLDALIEAIENFRGGPPTPMHPSPAADTILRRRHSRKSGEQAIHG